MPSYVFYSWQSDLPNRTNRGFIQDALERAAHAISDDDSIAVEPVIDRDTAGVPGSPDIASTIFSKIDRADVVVFDVTIVTAADAVRPMPNPNVLLELGYAIKAKGWDRIALVVNTAFGPIEQLPFDLRSRRAITYGLRESDADRSAVRGGLQRVLEAHIRSVLEHRALPAAALIRPTPLVEVAVAAIDGLRPDRGAAIRRFMMSVTDRLRELAPDWGNEAPRYDRLRPALDASVEVVADFCRVAQRASAMNDDEAVLALYRGLEPIGVGCTLPNGFGGRFWETQFDFYRFLAHEMMADLVAPLIVDERWEALRTVLARTLMVENAVRLQDSESVTFTYFSQPTTLLAHESDRQRAPFVRIELLKERYSAEPLKRTCPWTYSPAPICTSFSGPSCLSRPIGPSSRGMSRGSLGVLRFSAVLLATYTKWSASTTRPESRVRWGLMSRRCVST